MKWQDFCRAVVQRLQRKRALRVQVEVPPREPLHVPPSLEWLDGWDVEPWLHEEVRELHGYPEEEE